MHRELGRLLQKKRCAQGTVFVSDAAISEYVKRLANGSCDLCKSPTPFFNKLNEAYIECHHIVWLARGGVDVVENTVALCPNCHRKMDVLARRADKEELKKRVGGVAELVEIESYVEAISIVN